MPSNFFLFVNLLWRRWRRSFFFVSPYPIIIISIIGIAYGHFFKSLYTTPGRCDSTRTAQTFCCLRPFGADDHGWPNTTKLFLCKQNTNKTTY